MCGECMGTRRVKFKAEVRLGGKVVKTYTYDAECTRCRGIELWVASHGKERA